jgi:hypothetical protein
MKSQYKIALSIVALGATLYFKRSLMFYGLVNRQQIHDTVDKVVECLGGGINAKMLLLETSAAETGMGDAVDKSWNVGIGLMQFDEIGFIDVQQRTSRSKKDLVLNCFGVDIDRVVHTDLRWSPLLSVIFARLKFMLVPSSIPSTLQGRADYWKKWYNSTLGAGTPEHYMKSAQNYGLA